MCGSERSQQVEYALNQLGRLIINLIAIIVIFIILLSLILCQVRALLTLSQAMYINVFWLRMDIKVSDLLGPFQLLESIVG